MYFAQDLSPFLLQLVYNLCYRELIVQFCTFFNLVKCMPAYFTIFDGLYEPANMNLS